MKRRTQAWAVAPMLATILLLGACGEEEPDTAPEPTSTSSASPEPSATEPTADPSATPGTPQTAADLVGTWRDDATDWTAHFAADGTFTWDYQGNADFLTGTYTLADGVVTFSGLDGNDLAGQVTEGGLVFTLGTLTPR